jgi:hypothetical protein
MSRYKTLQVTKTTFTSSDRQVLGSYFANSLLVQREVDWWGLEAAAKLHKNMSNFLKFK